MKLDGHRERGIFDFSSYTNLFVIGGGCSEVAQTVKYLCGILLFLEFSLLYKSNHR